MLLPFFSKRRLVVTRTGLLLLAVTALVGCSPKAQVPVTQSTQPDIHDTLGQRLAACHFLANSDVALNTYRQFYNNEPVIDQEYRFQVTENTEKNLLLIRDLYNLYQPEDGSYTEYYLGEWQVDLNDLEKRLPSYDIQLIETKDSSYYSNISEAYRKLNRHFQTKVAGKNWDLYQIYLFDPEEEEENGRVSTQPQTIVYWNPLIGIVRTCYEPGNYFDLITASQMTDNSVIQALKALIPE